MIRVEADTLEEAYSKAAANLNCSVTELDIEIIQHPSRGIFGIFKKRAIITAAMKNENKVEQFSQKKKEFKYEQKSKEEIEKAAKEIEEKLNHLMKFSCFDLDSIKVSPEEEENGVLIEVKGKDAALLIGKEGYRYKAFSYMIYNWVNLKYKLNIKLEIAEFLKNQEEMIKRYLAPLKEKIREQGRGQTKPLDGVLIKIALKELREEFKDKYVSIKTNRDGQKYIIVNDFLRREK